MPGRPVVQVQLEPDDARGVRRAVVDLDLERIAARASDGEASRATQARQAEERQGGQAPACQNRGAGASLRRPNMDLRADAQIPFPRKKVFTVYRDDILKVVPYMTNVQSIEVRSRKEDGPSSTS